MMQTPDVTDQDADREAQLLRALETVMKSNEGRSVPPASRKRVLDVMILRYTEE